jgi:hypothetical protein
LAIGDIGNEGVAATLARSDHEHAFPVPSAPVNVTKSAASAGSSDKSAREDHKHDVATGTPAAIAIDVSSSEGVATSLARSDHQHGLIADVAVAVGTANAEGASTAFSRANHVHNHGDSHTSGSNHATVSSTGHGFQPRSHRAATVSPTANEDSGDGFEVGSYWINTTLDLVFVCVDASSGSAVWRETAKPSLVFFGGANMGGADAAKHFGAQEGSNGGKNTVLSSDNQMASGITGTFRVLTWNSQTADGTTVFKVIKNGANIQSFTLTGVSGSAHFAAAVAIAAGDLIAVEYDAGTAPGRTTVQVYA